MRRAVLLSLALVVGSAAGCGGGAGRERSPSPAPPARDVLWISVDTLRADRVRAVDGTGPETPAIDALAAEGTVFVDAWSTYPLTLPAHASAFTGRWPPGHGVRENRDFELASDVPTLAAALKGAGFATGGFVSTAVLRASTGIGRGFEAWDDPAVDETFASTQRPGRDTVDRALAWLEKRTGERVFQFVHLYEPHTPYEPPPRFVQEGESAYDGEIRAADHEIARLLDGWRRAGRYDDAWIVLFADHGEGLGDHGESEHGIFLYREATRVPLIVRRPGGIDGGARSDRPASLVDLPATTLAGIDGAPSFDSDGTDLFGPRDPEGRFLYMESFHGASQYDWAVLRALVHRDRHWIEAPREELYDLSRDPDQRVNLAASMPVPSIFRYELDAIGEGRLEEVGLSEEERRMLGSLGYVGGLTLRDATDRSNALDPKDGIATAERLWGAIRRLGQADDLGAEREVVRSMRELGVRNQTLTWTVANNLMRAGRVEAAAALLRPFDATGEPPVQQLLAEAESALGRSADAERRFRRILAWDEASPRAHLGLGVLALRAGRPAAAIPALSRALELDPALAEAWTAMGAARAAEGDLAAAEAAWREAVAHDPEDADAWWNLARAADLRGDRTAAQQARRRVRELGGAGRD